MERILRSQEMAEIILLPVRHHSPACAYHVNKMIESIRPSVILVEGPENANSLVPVMVHEETEAPFAIYYSYHDGAGQISGGMEHYKCYYPFLDYSPELAALRAGARLGIAAAFIDLPYGDILMASREGRGLLNREKEKSNYNDDYLLSRNAYLERLCERTGLRSFDEFWEKYFECNGIGEDSGKWFSNLLAYCTLARENTPPEVMEEEGCLARERYMAEQIEKYAGEAAYREGAVLVVTGGFHTPGLKGLLTEKGKETHLQELILEKGAVLEKASSETNVLEKISVKTELPSEEVPSIKARVSKKTEKSQQTMPMKGALLLLPKENQSVYLMPYTMEAADALNGYASGMPFTGFYQKIWEGLQKEETSTPYTDAVLELIVASGKETRKKEGYLSTYDEICACAMAKGLAQLRGKQEPGAYELIDAVMSSFIKGEYNLATDTPMRILRNMMTGSGMGKLCPQADVPPIIHDFQAQCGKLGLKANVTLETEITLAVFSNKKHRQISMFFHRMIYLKTAFAKKAKGPNLQLKRDKNLMREIWKYRWNVQVNAALIDVSVYGATIEEAAGSLVKEELKKEWNAQEGAILLTYVFEMGLTEQLAPVYTKVYERMQQDTDFYSLAEALKSLMMMEELAGLYGSSMEFGGMIHMGCRKLISLLPAMVRLKDEDLPRCMNVLKLLYQITGRGEELGQERQQYYKILEEMKEEAEIHAGLNGCIHGILYGSGRERLAEVQKACQGYLRGTKGQHSHTAQFFRGLFYTARDLVFIGEQFMKMLDTFLGEVPEGEFMTLLPELRIAFSYFTPREIDRIAAMAAAFHGKGERDILDRAEIYPDWYSYGKEVDEYVRKKMEENRKGRYYSQLF